MIRDGRSVRGSRDIEDSWLPGIVGLFEILGVLGVWFRLGESTHRGSFVDSLCLRCRLSGE